GGEEEGGEEEGGEEEEEEEGGEEEEEEEEGGGEEEEEEEGGGGGGGGEEEEEEEIVHLIHQEIRVSMKLTKYIVLEKSETHHNKKRDLSGFSADYFSSRNFLKINTSSNHTAAFGWAKRNNKNLIVYKQKGLKYIQGQRTYKYDHDAECGILWTLNISEAYRHARFVSVFIYALECDAIRASSRDLHHESERSKVELLVYFDTSEFPSYVIGFRSIREKANFFHLRIIGYTKASSDFPEKAATFTGTVVLQHQELTRCSCLYSKPPLIDSANAQYRLYLKRLTFDFK
ncbi:hypothetical protein C0J52_27104, partial [Blattella germanica]